MESVNLRDVLPSVMLTGPSGCGKTTVAMTVARRLDMNVHKVRSKSTLPVHDILHDLYMLHVFYHTCMSILFIHLNLSIYPCQC